MSNYIEILKLAFEVLIALLLLGVSIFLIHHYRKGEDVTALTFAVSSFSLTVVVFVTVVLSISINSFSVFSDHTYRYIPWFLSGGYLFFAIGSFVSVFLAKNKISLYFIPIILLMFVTLGIGFIPGIISGLPEYATSGVWVLMLAGIIFVAISLNYFLYWVRERQNFRIMMSVAFLILSLSMFLVMFVSNNNLLSVFTHLLRLVGFGIIFYEFQVGF